MAERRMFAKSIVDSDAFIDMPVTARLLYYDLGMRADDDGFVNSPKKIMRMIGASQDDLSILSAKKFIIPFENGVVVIKHWRIHNYIRKDTYNETNYADEKARLTLDEKNIYHLSVTKPSTDRQRSVDTGKVRIGKDSIGEDRLEKENTNTNVLVQKKSFVPPSVEEVRNYCNERKNGIDPEMFVDFYQSKGWMVGRNKMKDWKSAVRTWERKNRTAETKDVTSQWKEGDRWFDEG